MLWAEFQFGGLPEEIQKLIAVEQSSPPARVRKLPPNEIATLVAAIDGAFVSGAQVVDGAKSQGVLMNPAASASGFEQSKAIKQPDTASANVDPIRNSAEGEEPYDVAVREAQAGDVGREQKKTVEGHGTVGTDVGAEAGNAPTGAGAVATPQPNDAMVRGTPKGDPAREPGDGGERRETASAVAYDETSTEDAEANALEEVVPIIQESLNEREQEILCALLRLKALGKNRAVPRKRAAKKADPEAKSGSYNHAISSLVSKKLVTSQKGPGGGIWLTAAGGTIATSLEHRSA